MEKNLLKKNKTRKLKPTLEIVGDEEEIIQEPEVVEEPVLEGGMGDGEEEEKEVTLPIKFEGNNSEEKYYDSEDD